MLKIFMRGDASKKYLPYAKQQLALLKSQKKHINLKSISKKIGLPFDGYIRLSSNILEDKIDIYAPSEMYFLVTYEGDTTNDSNPKYYIIEDDAPISVSKAEIESYINYKLVDDIKDGLGLSEQLDVTIAGGFGKPAKIIHKGNYRYTLMPNFENELLGYYGDIVIAGTTTTYHIPTYFSLLSSCGYPYNTVASDAISVFYLIEDNTLKILFNKFEWSEENPDYNIMIGRGLIDGQFGRTYSIIPQYYLYGENNSKYEYVLDKYENSVFMLYSPDKVDKLSDFRFLRFHDTYLSGSFFNYDTVVWEDLEGHKETFEITHCVSSDNSCYLLEYFNCSGRHFDYDNSLGYAIPTYLHYGFDTIPDTLKLYHTDKDYIKIQKTQDNIITSFTTELYCNNQLVEQANEQPIVLQDWNTDATIWNGMKIDLLYKNAPVLFKQTDYGIIDNYHDENYDVIIYAKRTLNSTTRYITPYYFIGNFQDLTYYDYGSTYYVYEGQSELQYYLYINGDTFPLLDEPSIIFDYILSTDYPIKHSDEADLRNYGAYTDVHSVFTNIGYDYNGNFIGRNYEITRPFIDVSLLNQKLFISIDIYPISAYHELTIFSPDDGFTFLLSPKRKDGIPYSDLNKLYKRKWFVYYKKSGTLKEIAPSKNERITGLAFL